MDLQSDINFAGAVLPVLAAFVPGLAQAEGAVVAVEDGIKVEQGAYAWFKSPAGTQTRTNLTKLFGDLGVKVDFGDDGHVVVSRMSDDPYSPGFVMGGEGGGE